MSFHIRVSARGIVINNDKIKPPSIPDIDPNNPQISSEAKWVQISDLKDINYVPYIHEQLIKYIKTNNFSPVFIEEPLNKK